MFHHRQIAGALLATIVVSFALGCAVRIGNNTTASTSTTVSGSRPSDPPLKRMVYYTVEAFYCDSLTRWSATYNVGALCIEAALPSYVLPNGPSGQKMFFQTKTSATCDPPSTCVYLAVVGPYRTTDKSTCDGLDDCSCWPDLACATATCAPYDPNLDAPKDCPKCP